MARDIEVNVAAQPDPFAQVRWNVLDPELRRLFTAAGTRPPLILWSPTETEIGNSLIQTFARKMRALADAEGRVPAAAVSTEGLGELARWTLLLDVEGAEGPFRYRHAGDRILPYATRRDIIGRTSGDYGDFFGAFFTKLYSAAAARREWVFSEHDPPREVFIRTWQRLIVPLFGEDGETVTRFAVMAVPENALRAGLDLIVDPVFVLDEVQVIHYCNAAADRLFAASGVDRGSGATLKDVTGIMADVGLAPADLLTRGEAIELVELVPRGGVLERMAVTVSATQHRGRAFYIVVMRLIGT